MDAKNTHEDDARMKAISALLDNQLFDPVAALVVDEYIECAQLAVERKFRIDREDAEFPAIMAGVIPALAVVHLRESMEDRLAGMEEAFEDISRKLDALN
ncbi:hypothetical protein AGMMS49543_24360 [Betaproteobacteria bacterium]|nr:hypothetical protein AGMMS49543_24360 [Betaproteobacteria bacterium]GHU23554.1 hypothetical protein AGMMS50243_25170 [Betaproteobacteria bacterium]